MSAVLGCRPQSPAECLRVHLQRGGSLLEHSAWRRTPTASRHEGHSPTLPRSQGRHLEAHPPGAPEHFPEAVRSELTTQG